MDSKVAVGKINFKYDAYRILKGICISYIMTAISVFIYACLLVNTNIGESTIKPVILVISVLSILLGGFFSSIKIKKKGIINGMAVGIGYSFIVYFLSSVLLTGFQLEIYSILFMILATIMGAIGGIIGVNMG